MTMKRLVTRVSFFQGLGWSNHSILSTMLFSENFFWPEPQSRSTLSKKVVSLKISEIRHRLNINLTCFSNFDVFPLKQSFVSPFLSVARFVESKNAFIWRRCNQEQTCRDGSEWVVLAVWVAWLTSLCIIHFHHARRVTLGLCNS